MYHEKISQKEHSFRLKLWHYLFTKLVINEIQINRVCYCVEESLALNVTAYIVTKVLGYFVSKIFQKPIKLLFPVQYSDLILTKTDVVLTKKLFDYEIGSLHVK